MPPISRALAFNRFGLGPKPGDLQRASTDPRAELLAELDATGARPGESKMPSSAEIFLAIRKYTAIRKGAKANGDQQKVADLGKAPQLSSYIDEITALTQKTLAAEIGFFERLVAFWGNHFTVSGLMNGVAHGLVGSFEREAIRPNVLGNFHDMLLAATRHPAMLIYLNNFNSVGPHSERGLKRERGLNENHARELLELHTVGVDGGYTQADVTSFARVLTGWSVDLNEKKPETCGHFVFRPMTHEPGPATVMGVNYPQEGEAQGEAVIADLARSPATARHLAKKFAIHFVADEPPDALVEGLALTFQHTNGDLRAVTTALIQSDLAWEQPTKLKTPQEFVWSSLRALSLDAETPFVRRILTTLGQPLWSPTSPRGFSDDSSTWLAPDAITNRLDIATDLATRAQNQQNPVELAKGVLGPTVSAETTDAISRAESRVQALALMLMSPEFQRR